MLAESVASSQTEDIEALWLCPADCAVQLRVMAPLYFARPLASHEEFMDFDILEKSFHITLSACLPHVLKADLQQMTRAREQTPARPGLPLATKHIDDYCTIAKMRASDFMPGAQPVVISSASTVSDPLGGDPLATLDVVYMSDGVGVLVAISHAVVDMAAYCRFVTEWGLVARDMLKLGCKSEELACKPPKLDVDRQKFWSQATAQCFPRPALPLEIHLDRLFAENNVDTAPSVNASLFRLSIDASGIAELSKTRDKVCPGVSVPNLISAIMWRAIVLAYPRAKYAYFAASMMVRSLPEFSEYWGSASTVKYIHAETEMFRSSAWIREVAQMVQDNVQAFTVNDFVDIISWYDSGENTHCKYLAKYVENGHVPRLMMSNISRIRFYDIDFGYGPAVKAVYPAVGISGLGIMMPRAQTGGIDIYACLPDVAAASILADELVREHINIDRI
ncbi:hypothetical protein GGI04_002648 [Coemansia thaxteri]|uniref:Uncharacterized protein n=1 Tax=Coemansia thaxteri TaxID=2663907 RepID=A0A9W8BJS0_9FUNG|nr:hypothetical protein GGI04_002648 [Coemansia thaxteri]KAJ2005464.1 hypothetical protein H4R26_001946 [Coemansia thaxteri]KAJ2471185.1 hypothetical protein GGI02_002441 [Coemansia sp. RSA 2322]